MDEFLAGFSHQAATQPDKQALEEWGLTLTYRQLNEASDFTAHTLARHGMTPGRIVAYLGGSGLQRMVGLIGAIKAGTPFLVLDERQPAGILADLIKHAGAGSILLHDPQYLPLAKQLQLPIIDGPAAYPLTMAPLPFAIPAIDPETIGYFRYTSGSTGKPKGVPVRRWVENELIRLADRDQRFRPSDRIALFGHFWPQSALATLSKGGSIYCFDFPARGPKELLGWLRENKITVANTYAAIFRAMEVAPRDRLPDLRLLRLSGELLLRRDIEKFESFATPGAELHNGFGTSECSYIASHVRRAGEPIAYDRVPIGRPCQPEYFAIVDGNGRPVPPGETGEMVLYSPPFVGGYHNDPERTAAVFRPLPHLNAAVAYFTGDQGFFDKDGIIHPVGRADDQVKIRGYVVRPAEIETVVKEFDGVSETAVVAFDGPRNIRRLACYVVPADAAAFSISGLRTFLREKLPGYMVPGIFLLQEKFPKTTTGKILRRALPEPLAAQGDCRGGKDAAIGETERTLAGLWTDILGHADFGRDDDFFDAGGDSLQAMAMVTGIEQQTGFRMPLETLVLDGATIARLAERNDVGTAIPTAQAKALNRSKSGLPIHAVPVIGGHLSDYLSLAHVLEDAASFVGLPFQEREIKAGRSLSIEDLAEEIAQQTSEGAPLIGYSFGGVIAFEAARQLAEQRPSVPLILVDPVPVWLDPLRMLRSIWRAARQGNLEKAQQRVSALATGTVKAATIDDLHALALHRYRPSPHPIKNAVLVLAADNPRKKETQREWLAER